MYQILQVTLLKGSVRPATTKVIDDEKIRFAISRAVIVGNLYDDRILFKLFIGNVIAQLTKIPFRISVNLITSNNVLVHKLRI